MARSAACPIFAVNLKAMKKQMYMVGLLLMPLFGWSQTAWTVEQCMRYAVKHNHEVTQQRLTVEDYRSDKTQAVGAFLPSLHASVGNQYNFGRAIDPETNTYTNVSTFYNGYSVSASIPLFDGFQRVSEWRLAKANLLMGRHGLRAKQDEVALAVFQAYIDLLYYRGTVEMARQKREESAQLLRQTRTMAEVGTKSEADVAQMEATQAADDYEVTRQEGLLAQALLVLKRQMNYPAEETLIVEPMADDEAEPIEEPTDSDAAAIVEVAQVINPKLLEAEQSLSAAKQSLRVAKSGLYPTISLGAGISTSYYKTIGNANAKPFGDQFRNNVGEYLSATLSIPLFNRLTTLTQIRKQRHAVRRAEENLAYQRSELERLIAEALIDRENSRMESRKMAKKVEADRLAARLTIRQYEEGLATSIDVQTATVTLLQSQAQQLQSRLTFLYKDKWVNYYKGEALWTE